jgi:hypothetical protein
MPLTSCSMRCRAALGIGSTAIRKPFKSVGRFFRLFGRHKKKKEGSVSLDARCEVSQVTAWDKMYRPSITLFCGVKVVVELLLFHGV